MAEATHESGGHVSTVIAVTVTFPISKKGPYAADVPADTTVGAVRQAAMTHFEVQNDAQFTYVLTHAGKDEADSLTVGEIADHAHALQFQLVKKITQG